MNSTRVPRQPRRSDQEDRHVPGRSLDVIRCLRQKRFGEVSRPREEHRPQLAPRIAGTRSDWSIASACDFTQLTTLRWSGSTSP